jgi:hypothetical protein
MNMSDFRKAVKALLVSALVGLTSLAQDSAVANPINMNILSDSSWLASDVGASGWQQLGFDDSGWVAARAPYPNNPGIAGSAAQAIWYDPTSSSNGTTGVTTAFFRRTFNLDIQPDSLPLVGQALLSVDDDYAFYVNGHLALLNNDGGFANLVQFVDFTNLLVNGANVFAIQAVDGAWGSPFNRGFERVAFDAKITTIPEPSMLLIVCIALGAAAVSRVRPVAT